MKLEQSASRLKVCDLFNETGSDWDEIKVVSLLPPTVVDCVLAIPLFPHGNFDCVRWIHAKNGIFSVKSGYWTAKKIKDVQASKPSSSTNNPAPWKWFWQLNLPPKVRVFMWRCMKGILPTKAKLLRRGIDIDPICSRCGSNVETIEHALRDCEWVSFYWKTCILRLHNSGCNPLVPFQDWVLAMIRNKNPDFIELFVMFMWSIWNCRNHWVFRQSDTPHQIGQSAAISLLHEYQQHNGLVTQREKTSSPCKWSAPPINFLKLNSDASLHPDGTAGLGGVLRDHHGNLLRAFSGILPRCANVELAEAAACLQGVKMAIDLPGSYLIIEMDCQGIINLLRGGDAPPTQVGTVMLEILHLTRHFEDVSFSWVSRSCNTLAHEAARLAADHVFVDFDLANLPVSLRRIAAADVAVDANE